jgi:hypothetical protein
MLEPCAVKVARTVLRGVGGRKATYLPDIREIASDTLRVRFEWNLSEYVCMYVFSFLLLLTTT